MRRSLVAVVATAAPLAAFLLTSDAGGKSKPQPCPAKRYILRAGGDALVADSTPLPAAVAFDGKQIALGAHCAFRNGTVRATKSATKLAGHWPTCGALKNVSLKATIAYPDCSTMTGSFKAKKLKAQAFTATLTGCGDGVLDAMNAESCDGSSVGCAAGKRCNATCQCEDVPVITPATTTTTTPLITIPTTTVTTTTAAATTSTTASTSTSTTLGGPTTTSTTIPGCGDGIRNGDETCDDGPNNGMPGDPCPANCIIAACTPVGGSARSFNVNFTVPAGKQLTGITVNLDYPEGKVSIPGSGGDSNVLAAITHLPFGAFAQPNDVDWALVETVAKGTPITIGRLFEITFNDCQGATPPALGDFTCTVTDASDNSTPPQKLAGVTCSVTATP